MTWNAMFKSPLIFVLLFYQRQLLSLELHERNVHMTTDQKSLPEDEKTSFMKLKNNNYYKFSLQLAET